MPDGYDEYKVIESIINAKLKDKPITKDNAMIWLTFGRMMEVDGRLIQDKALELLGVQVKKTIQITGGEKAVEKPVEEANCSKK